MKYWFIAVIQTFFKYDEDELNDSEISVQESYTLIAASTPSDAYKKAMEHGEAANGIEGVDETGNKGRVVFIGVDELLPLYDPIGDGCTLIDCDIILTQEEISRKIEERKNDRTDLHIFNEWKHSIKVTIDNKKIYP
jgi:hypothetical protein